MSDPTSTKKAPKNTTGMLKIERIAQEKAARVEKHEEDMLNHNRKTEESRKAWAHLVTRRERSNKFATKADIDIAALLAGVEKLRQQKAGWKEALEMDEEKFGADAAVGEKAAEVTAKYEAYLALESDELDL